MLGTIQVSLDNQDEKTLLWIRRAFFKHDEAIDEKRCILFGHTPTSKFNRVGEIVQSKIRLDDGRPSWLAMDTSAYNHENPGIAAYDLTTGDTVRQKTLRSEHWWLKTDSREAPVAEFFGLAELREGAPERSSPLAKGETKIGDGRLVSQCQKPSFFPGC